MVHTERVPTGIIGLDRLIEGGFPKGRSILVTGEPGTGKSIFSLQFLVEGLARGEKGVYVAADEEPSDIIEQGESMGWELEKYTAKKELLILNVGAHLSAHSTPDKEKHIDITRAVNDLAAHVLRLEAKRLVLDPAGPFVLLRDTAIRIQDQARLLIKLLRTAMPTTNVLTSYAVPRTGEMTMHGVEEYLTAGVLVFKMLSKNGRLTRNLILEKMRCTDVKPVQHEFDIVKGKGIVLHTEP
jgi:circadian clock protein KaiC